MAKLVSHTGHTFDLPTVPISFGEEPTNDVVVPAEFGLAANHFVLWPQGLGHVLRDSGSGIGCWVNGRPVLETELHDGDEILAGKLRLTYQCPEVPKLPSVPLSPTLSFLDPLPQQLAKQDAAAQQAQMDFAPSRHLNDAQSMGFAPTENEVVTAMVQVLPAESFSKPANSLLATGPEAPAWMADDVTDSPEESAPKLPQKAKTSAATGIRWRWIATTVGLMAASSYGTFYALNRQQLAAQTNLVQQQRNTPTPEQVAAVVVAPKPTETVEKPALPVAPSGAPVASPEQPAVEKTDAATPPAEDEKQHEAALRRILFPTATSLHSIKYPDAEIFYTNHALQRGLPFPTAQNSVGQRELEIPCPDPLRVSSVHAEPEMPGLVLLSLKSAWDVKTAAQQSGKAPEEKTWGGQTVQIYPKSDGQLIAVSNLGPNLVLVGPETLVQSALEKGQAVRTSEHSLLPKQLAGNLGSYLWTTTCDDSLLAEAGETSAEIDLKSIASVVFRYCAGDATPSQCLAIRRDGADQGKFNTAARHYLDNLVQNLEQKALAKAGGVGYDKMVTTTTDEAQLPFQSGLEFVNLILETHFAPAKADLDGIAILQQARRVAHQLNLASAERVIELPKAKNIAEALALLDTGMLSRERNNFEIQVSTTPEERTILEDFLHFENGLWSCRMAENAYQRKDAAYLEEALNRLNADNVISLVRPPSSKKVVKIPNMAAYVRASLEEIVQKSIQRRANACPKLFGMPLPNDKELEGMVKYLTQNEKGLIAMKPGEPTWGEWSIPKRSPEDREVETISALAKAAKLAGNKELAAVQDPAEMVKLLTTGVTGSGSFAGTEFRYAKPEAASVLAATLGKLAKQSTTPRPTGM
jgi:hypothetical protein